MKLTFKGKYVSEADLPVRDHPTGYVPFREAESMTKMALLLNLLAVPLQVLTLAVFFWRALPWLPDAPPAALAGVWLALALLLPHEMLHALCFRESVELYTNLKQGLVFVVGTEDMSRAQFVFMCLLPNLLFGALPFALFLLQPQWLLLGTLGAFSIPMGTGDYYNVFNCLTQVPRGGLVYMSGMHSYWYLP